MPTFHDYYKIEDFIYYIYFFFIEVFNDGQSYSNCGWSMGR
jgi:hypothetical protein